LEVHHILLLLLAAPAVDIRRNRLSPVFWKVSLQIRLETADLAVCPGRRMCLVRIGDETERGVQAPDSGGSERAKVSHGVVQPRTEAAGMGAD
jgi:hypothetical protein